MERSMAPAARAAQMERSMAPAAVRAGAPAPSSTGSAPETLAERSARLRQTMQSSKIAAVSAFGRPSSPGRPASPAAPSSPASPSRFAAASPGVGAAPSRFAATSPGAGAAASAGAQGVWRLRPFLQPSSPSFAKWFGISIFCHGCALARPLGGEGLDLDLMARAARLQRTRSARRSGGLRRTLKPSPIKPRPSHPCKSGIS